MEVYGIQFLSSGFYNDRFGCHKVLHDMLKLIFRSVISIYIVFIFKLSIFFSFGNLILCSIKKKYIHIIALYFIK